MDCKMILMALNPYKKIQLKGEENQSLQLNKSHWQCLPCICFPFLPKTEGNPFRKIGSLLDNF